MVVGERGKRMGFPFFSTLKIGAFSTMNAAISLSHMEFYASILYNDITNKNRHMYTSRFCKARDAALLPVPKMPRASKMCEH